MMVALVIKGRRAKCGYAGPHCGQKHIAELANVITGRASMKLAEAGYEANISTPSLILGSGATISTLDCPRLIVPLKTSIGSMTIHLALREGQQRVVL